MMATFISTLMSRLSSTTTLILMVRLFAATELLLASITLFIYGGFFPIWILGASTVSALLYLADWYSARNRTWQVPSFALHTVDTLWGWPGGALAQVVVQKEMTPKFAGRFLAGVFVSVLVPAVWLLVQ